jgi:hypothetical protein
MLAQTMAFWSAQGAPPGGDYTAYPVAFDGASYARRGGVALVGAANSGRVTFGFAIKLLGAAADQHIVSVGTTATRFSIGRFTGDQIYVYGRNVAGQNTLYIITSTALTAGQWYKVVGSVDLSNASLRSIYINDVADSLTVNAYTIGGVVQFNAANAAVGALAPNPANNRLNGQLADVWFDWGRYTEFSVEANRRKFFNADGTLVDKGSDGSLPFGVAPIGFFAGPTVDWHLNKGSGGGMDEYGALTDGSW